MCALLVSLFGVHCSGTQLTGECVTASDCSPDFACVNGSCTAIVVEGCRTDEDCGASEYCEPATGMCEPRAQVCFDHTDCPLNQFCDPVTSTCMDGPRPATDAGLPDSGVEDATSAPADAAAAEAGVDASQVVDAGMPDLGPPDTGPTDTGEHPDAAPPPCADDNACSPPMTICENMSCVPGCGVPGGLACGMDEVCDTNTGRCVMVMGPCQDDMECGPPQMVCEGGQCVPGCAELGGIQCFGNTVCNGMTGRCEPGPPICTSDMDCNPPMTVCNLVSGNCDPGCGVGGCVAPLMCNTTTGHCVMSVTCMEDRFEENDSSAAATAIPIGAQRGLRSCEADEDWYQVTLAANEQVAISLTFAHGEGNIDIELLDPSNTVVASGVSTTDNETINHTATAAGVYRLRVIMVSDTGPVLGNDYDLTIGRVGTMCMPDSEEDDDDRGSATLIIPPTNQPNLTQCSGDDDYFVLIVNTDDIITVNATFSHAEGDVDLFLENFLGVTVARSDTTTDNESIVYTALRPGTLNIRVTLFADLGVIPGNSYALSVTRQ